MKVLAFDPGKNNFAFAVINSKGKCKHRGFVRSFKSLADTKVRENVRNFKNDILDLIDRGALQMNALAANCVFKPATLMLSLVMKSLGWPKLTRFFVRVVAIVLLFVPLGHAI